VLDEIFNPRSIAVVGASPDPNKAGYHFFKGLVDLKFDGAVYPINLNGSDVLGFKATGILGMFLPPSTMLS